MAEPEALIESSFRRLLASMEAERDQIRNAWQRLAEEGGLERIVREGCRSVDKSYAVALLNNLFEEPHRKQGKYAGVMPAERITSSSWCLRICIRLLFEGHS